MDRARRILLVIALGAALWGGCRKQPPAGDPGGSGDPSRPGGSLVGPEFRFSIVVYHLRPPAKDPSATLASLVARQSDLMLVKALLPGTADRPTLALVQGSVGEFPPPSAETLAHFGRGLSEEQIRALPDSASLSALMVVGPGARALASYRQALALAGDLAQACGGLIWDDEARLMYTLEAWRARRAGWTADGIPDVRQHIAIHAYRDGELLRMITVGMRKFALPDVVVNQVATGHQAMNTVVNLLCQRLVEGAPVSAGGTFTLAVDGVVHPEVRASVGSAPGAPRRAVLQLGPGKAEQGDADNALLELRFPGPPGKRQEQHAALLDQLFGSEKQVVATRGDDQVRAASARARQAVLRHKPRFRKQPPLGEQLLVKAPFRASGGVTEWMWVKVVRWEGQTIRGVLQSQPRSVPGLSSGSRVEVAEASLFDYILTRPDGSREGNETGKLIEQRR